MQEYADRYPDRITHYRSGRRFGSAQKHFMHLLEQFGDQADYVMFCDQDDVWHPDKVRLTLRLMEQVETDPSLPVLVHTDLRVVDGELREMDPRSSTIPAWTAIGCPCPSCWSRMWSPAAR